MAAVCNVEGERPGRCLQVGLCLQDCEGACCHLSRLPRACSTHSPMPRSMQIWRSPVQVLAESMLEKPAGGGTAGIGGLAMAALGARMVPPLRRLQLPAARDAVQACANVARLSMSTELGMQLQYWLVQSHTVQMALYSSTEPSRTCADGRMLSSGAEGVGTA